MVRLLEMRKILKRKIGKEHSDPKMKVLNWIMIIGGLPLACAACFIPSSTAAALMGMVGVSAFLTGLLLRQRP